MSVVDLTCRLPVCSHKGTYRLPVRCLNCGFTGTGEYSQGHEADLARCPTCDTRNLRPVRA